MNRFWRPITITTQSHNCEPIIARASAIFCNFCVRTALEWFMKDETVIKYTQLLSRPCCDSTTVMMRNSSHTTHKLIRSEIQWDNHKRGQTAPAEKKTPKRTETGVGTLLSSKCWALHPHLATRRWCITLALHRVEGGAPVHEGRVDAQRVELVVIHGALVQAPVQAGPAADE